MRSIPCRCEVVSAFLRLEQVADVADFSPQRVVGSGGGLADQCLELGECHLDRVEVGTVRRQEQEPRADVFQDAGGLRAAVGGEVVEDHDIALLQGRGQLGFDIEVEEFAVYWPTNDPGRVQPVMAQGGDEGLGLPVSEGGVIDQTRPAGGPSCRLGHVGLERGFVDKPYACQHVTHEWLAAVDPDIARQRDIRPLLLDRPQVFFCVSGQGHAGAARPRRGGPRHHARPATRPPVHPASGRAFP